MEKEGSKETCNTIGGTQLTVRWVKESIRYSIPSHETIVGWLQPRNDQCLRWMFERNRARPVPWACKWSQDSVWLVAPGYWHIDYQISKCTTSWSNTMWLDPSVWGWLARSRPSMKYSPAICCTKPRCEIMISERKWPNRYSSVDLRQYLVPSDQGEFGVT